jgi:predicted phage terminase large subunit-like protein
MGKVIEFWDALEAEGKKIKNLDGVVRALALTDLFYLLVRVCRRPDMLHPWLYARVREVESSPNGHLDLWSREHYKDLADDTPMLTFNRGWTTHGELKVGDVLYAPNGLLTSVLAITEGYKDSECYKLTFSDGVVLVAGAGHLWRVRRKVKRRISGSDLRSVEWVDEIVQTNRLPERADIGAMQSPICGEAKQLLIDPYVLGCWLGDGESAAGRICGVDDEIFSRIEEKGYRLSHNHCSKREPFQTRTVYGLVPILKSENLLKNKHIPQIYQEASIHQRMELLRGLMDTDGHCNTRGTATFCNQNETLARQTYELAIGLALRPNIRWYINSEGGYWQVSFQAHKDRNPFFLKRKAERAIEPSAHRNCRDVVSCERIDSVPTRCIQVDGGMYLAGKNLIPTHNSTVITFGLTIQDILKDPETTIGIFSHTRPIAKAFLRMIMREFESNQVLHATFPDVLWGKDTRSAQKWSEDDGIIVKRKSNPNEATIEAWGLVDGQPTSKHFKVLLYDDIVVAASVTTPEMIEKTRIALEQSYNLGRTEGGVKRFAGTRWHFDDAYKTLIDRGTAIPRVHPGREGGTEEGKPVFWSEKVHEEKRRDMGPHTYSAQILLNPKADSLKGFKREWLRYYTQRPKHTNNYILVDSANSKRKESDYTCMWVIGLGSDNNFYALDVVRDRLSLTERSERLFTLHRKWKPKQVRWEQYGLMADIQHIKTEMENQSYRFDIIEVAGRTGKEDRIGRLIPIFEQGRFYLMKSHHVTDYQKNVKDLVHDFIEDEFMPFPVSSHKDMLDSLARLIEPDLKLIWPKEKPDVDFKQKQVYNGQVSTGWMAS